MARRPTEEGSLLFSRTKAKQSLEAHVVDEPGSAREGDTLGEELEIPDLVDHQPSSGWALMEGERLLQRLSESKSKRPTSQLGAVVRSVCSD